MKDIKKYIAEYPDFPKEGIHFKDVSPLLADPGVFSEVCESMAQKCRGADKLVALDARGFLFAPLIAQILSVPCVMVRKAGKLPGELQSLSYNLEYGSATIEIQRDAIHKGEKIAIIDDLLATGGTAMAAAKLIEFMGASVSHLAFVISLDDPFLKNMEKRQELEKYSYSSEVHY